MNPLALNRLRKALAAATGAYVEVCPRDLLAACERLSPDATADALAEGCRRAMPAPGKDKKPRPVVPVCVLTEQARYVLERIQAS